MPSLTQLEYALAIDDFRHFGKAAASIPVAQPTLSQQLQRLEDELGLMLFDRQQKPILPTPEGTVFLAQARRVVAEYRQLLAVAKSGGVTGELVGEFRLGIIPTVSAYLTPLFLQAFAKKCPHVSLVLEELKTDNLLEGLNSDKLDGGVLATPTQVPGFKEHPMYCEPLWLFCSPGHPLLQKTRVARSDIHAEELWMLQDGHCFKDQILNFCQPKTRQQKTADVGPSVRFESGSLETLKNLVRSGTGYALLPGLMAVSLEGKDKSLLRPFQAPVPAREISFVYRRDHWKQSIIKALKETILSSLPAKGIHLAHDRQGLQTLAIRR